MSTHHSQAVVETHTSRRELLKKAAYATPVIFTLTAVPAYAKKGSGERREKDKEKDKDPKKK